MLTGMSPDQRIVALAAQQHAVFTYRQAREAGLSDRMIEGRLRLGIWERVHHVVYRIAGAPTTHEQRILAACLSTGHDAVASHRSAAYLWELDNDFRGAVEITMPRARSTDFPDVVTHRSSDLIPEHVTVRHGVPVTKPARTLVDLGAVTPRWVVDRAIDVALARRLITIDGLWWMLAKVARRGRSGAGVLRECLEWRFGVPESVLEGLFLRIVHDFDLPEPIVQYEVNTPGGDYRIDAAYPDRLLAVELDGAQARMSPDALHYDNARQNELVDMGWQFLRFGFPHLTTGRADTARRVRRLHAALPVLEQVSHR